MVYNKTMMKTSNHKLLLFIAFSVLFVLGLWILFKKHILPSQNILASVVYSCDAGRSISATYYEEAVEISLDGGSSVTLPQTISASGARYANPDESFIFWNKGNEALIMRDNVMDLTYSNCKYEQK